MEGQRRAGIGKMGWARRGMEGAWGLSMQRMWRGNFPVTILTYMQPSTPLSTRGTPNT